MESVFLGIPSEMKPGICLVVNSLIVEQTRGGVTRQSALFSSVTSCSTSGGVEQVQVMSDIVLVPSSSPCQFQTEDQEYAFRQMLPWPDFSQVTLMESQLELVEPEGLSDGSRRRLAQFERSLQRTDDALERADERVAAARERLDVAEQSLLEAKLSSIATERDLRLAEAAEERAAMAEEAERQE